MYDPVTKTNVTFAVNDIYLPDGAFFYCPKCAESYDLCESDQWPVCKVDGNILKISSPMKTPDPETGNTVYLNLYPCRKDLKTYKIRRVD